MPFGDVLKKYRTLRALSLRELERRCATHCTVSWSLLGKIEAGTRDAPREVLATCVQVLGIPAADLVAAGVEYYPDLEEALAVVRARYVTAWRQARAKLLPEEGLDTYLEALRAVPAPAPPAPAPKGSKTSKRP